MIIHIVRPGETTISVAKKYHISPSRLMLDNGLTTEQLVTGQAITILYPTETYVVQPNDTLESIAEKFHITVSQLLRNNNYLVDSYFLIPGESIVISYHNNNYCIDTNGYTNYSTDRETLKRIFPYLTYVSIFGYEFTQEIDLVEIDDAEIVDMAKAYGVAPLILVSGLSLQGKGDVENVYNIFLDDKLIDKQIDSFLRILKMRGYAGINISLNYINKSNFKLYRNYIHKVSDRLKSENYKIFITMNPNLFRTMIENLKTIDIDITLKKIDGITVSDYKFGQNLNPPAPVISISEYNTQLDEISKYIEPHYLYIGCPLVGYGWELPYISGVTRAVTLKLDSVMEIAEYENTVIKFDIPSQTPFFSYSNMINPTQNTDIIWFIDARTLRCITELTQKYGLTGTGTWNIMYFYAPLWSVINSQFKINKILPEP